MTDSVGEEKQGPIVVLCVSVSYCTERRGEVCRLSCATVSWSSDVMLMLLVWPLRFAFCVKAKNKKENTESELSIIFISFHTFTRRKTNFLVTFSLLAYGYLSGLFVKQNCTCISFFPWI